MPSLSDKNAERAAVRSKIRKTKSGKAASKMRAALATREGTRKLVKKFGVKIKYGKTPNPWPSAATKAKAEKAAKAAKRAKAAKKAPKKAPKNAPKKKATKKVAKKKSK